jgi:hypothetical protein
MLTTPNKLPTWYVLSPRDEPCAAVNPKLWAEFIRHNNAPIAESAIHTEAFCVQWLDQLYLDVDQSTVIADVDMQHVENN